ncbi:MAG: signal recognition particle subunit SRP19/SEC65 family protein [Candidatus Odinarchaeia archaeon]
MKKKDRIIIWPQYFDKHLPRHKGRKIPLKLAVDSPKLEDLVNAATKLRLTFEIENEARYPAFWWKKSGRILVKKAIPKYSLLKRMASFLRK